MLKRSFMRGKDMAGVYARNCLMDTGIRFQNPLEIAPPPARHVASTIPAAWRVHERYGTPVIHAILVFRGLERSRNRHQGGSPIPAR